MFITNYVRKKYADILFVVLFCDTCVILFVLYVVVQKGEVNVDQAHRGCNMASDDAGYRSVNPLFMKYTPTDGRFSGQLGYGYR